MGYIPNFRVNLFSLTKAIENGAALTNEGRCIVLTMENEKYKFNLTTETKRGYISEAKLIPEILTCEDQKIETGNISTEKSAININTFHARLGHVHEEMMRRTEKVMGIKLVGTLPSCTYCALAKAKKKKISKLDLNKSETKGERISTDISYINQPSLGGAKYWIMVVDQATRMKWSRFVKVKSEMAPIIIEILRIIQQDGNTVRFIRCDNAGENKIIKDELVKQEIKNIEMEFTAPRTPEQNALVERPFSFLWNRVREMLNGAGFDEKMRKSIWAECANMSMQLDNSHVRKKGISNYESYHGKPPKIWKEYRCFGEMAVVKTCDKIQSKLKNKGTVVMMIGYCESHSRGTYRFLNMTTKKVMMSRDVTWPNCLYGDHYKVESKNRTNVFDVDFYQLYFTDVDVSSKEMRSLEYENKTLRAGRTKAHSKRIEDGNNATTIEKALCSTCQSAEPISFEHA